MVIRKFREALMAAVCLAAVVSAIRPSRAQDIPDTETNPPAKPITQSISAETLYLQLRSVGLDKARVYRIRETSFDRAAFHITLDDGTIAFTEDVAGRITGAFFEGEGEVLLIPSNQAERASTLAQSNHYILVLPLIIGCFEPPDDVLPYYLPPLSFLKALPRCFCFICR